MDGTVAEDGFGDAPEAEADADSNMDVDGGAEGGCGLATCEKGCCTPDGTCIEPQPNQSQCGDHGEACETCPEAGYCKQGTCFHFTDGPCNASNCEGCCFQGTDWCASGIHARACGHGGGHCDACDPCTPLEAGGGECLDAAPPCSPDNCPGCCTADGTCAIGTQPFACGKGGVACDDCVFHGTHCVEQVCSK